MSNTAQIDLQKWDEEMDRSDSDKHKLYDQLRAALESGDNAEILWRLSRVSIYLSKEALNQEFLRKKVTEALGYADKACQLDPKNFNCHKWFCASVGKMSALVGTKEKIRYGHEFKEHANIAMGINPNDWYMCFMYGRWCYEVASLTWIERKLASTLYSSPPNASFHDAFKYLQKSNDFNSQSKETYLWIAKTLLALKQNSEAKKWIEKGLKLNSTNVADSLAHKEMLSLKNKC